jgi:serine/threonine-protein kinase
VDAAGNVYVVDHDNKRLMMLAAESNALTELPLDGSSNPSGVAVDKAGNIYVADTLNNRVVELPAL